MASRVLFLLATIALFAGCNRSPVVPVSGSISFADRDIPEVCRLSFVPMDTADGKAIRPNAAEMDAEGKYELSEFKGVKGLLPGSYTIRMSYFDLKPNGNPERDGDWKETTYEAGELTIEEGSRAIKHNIVVE